MIRLCRKEDTDRMYLIVNEAAQAYAGHIPVDCYHQPYMPLTELKQEMQKMSFYGWEDKGELIGVMCAEPVKDVTLLRHAYVRTAYQGQGIGSRLLQKIVEETRTKRLLVGTWADATWAVDFYKAHGFKLQNEKDTLLKTYWKIPQRQIDTSVVMERVLGN
jgi:GNAT superfamily N-acetyltransferase